MLSKNLKKITKKFIKIGKKLNLGAYSPFLCQNTLIKVTKG